MTFAQKLVDLLEQNGMWPDEAKTVAEIVKSDVANEAMSGRWNDDISGYPATMVAILWISAKTTALKWIDENHRLAWYRGMFT